MLGWTVENSIDFVGRAEDLISQATDGSGIDMGQGLHPLFARLQFDHRPIQATHCLLELPLSGREGMRGFRFCLLQLFDENASICFEPARYCVMALRISCSRDPVPARMILRCKPRCCFGEIVTTNLRSVISPSWSTSINWQTDVPG